MTFSKTIRDPMHGDILLTDLEIRLLDSRPVQRLRRIRQNGLCFLVYPAMNSTRFEHSLGVMYLAGVMAETLKLDEKDLLRVAGLLHDIGHGPLSHTSDTLMESFGITHEKNTAKIIGEELAGTLGEYDISSEEVSDLVLGRSRLSEIISSEIDADKMDYLMRDSYYAGVAYGVIDVERIISSFMMVGDEIIVSEEDLAVIESLLISRNLMYQTVYRHHTKRIAECMIREALLQVSKSDDFSIEDYVRMDDTGMFTLLRTSEGYPKDVIGRLDERRLFKTVCRQRIKSLDISVEKIDTAELASSISSAFGIPEGYVLADLPEANLSEFKIKVEHDGTLKTIGEVSSLAKALEKSEEDKLTLGVYASPEHVAKFSDFNLNDYL